MSSENREAIKKKNWENFGSVSFQFGILPSFLREGGGMVGPSLKGLDLE